MASFDIVSKVDGQNLDNAINTVKREITTRYDFRGSKTTIELDKKTDEILITTEDSMKVQSIEDIIIQRVIKQGIDARGLDLSKEEYSSGPMIKKEIKVKQGIDKETAKKIVKSIKDTKAKVEASIMDDQIRVTGKKLDELQAIMAHLRKTDFEIALQFVNFK